MAKIIFNYYLGQIVGESDLDQIFTQLNDVERTLSKEANLAQGPVATAPRSGGILNGLVVTRTTDTTVTVTAGAARDSNGIRAALASAATVNLANAGDTPAGDDTLAVGDGAPPTGEGLANPLAVMARNFDVLYGQLGFNNPQVETNRFSLRHELFRCLPHPDGDDTWQSVLNKDYWTYGYGVVDNLWNVPEFRRFCVVPAGFGTVEPGLVIPFSTTIEEGKNFFGREVGGQDSSYDSTQFATKIRSVGIWFSNYDVLGLSNTPRVYLVPAGNDVLRAPSGHRGYLREFAVLDQVLPVPFPIGSHELDDPSWIPRIDSLSGDLGSIRRFGRLRAYHDSGEFKINEVSRDSRLIGRSVWNRRWMLIIPGSTFSNDSGEGLERLINGRLVGNERNGNGVSDIKIFFETYAYPRLNKLKSAGAQVPTSSGK